mmetsp:Transcript_24742/g.68904  ORF Transcript_24742/g.68904 Transcript_24742/m.68904 type:complete len:685 (+) Transcript_24742:259-2313(+)
MVHTRNARQKGHLSRNASKGVQEVVKKADSSRGASKTPATKRPLAKTSSMSANKSGVATGTKVRVWWAPNDEKDRTEYGGMYWPATFVKKAAGNKIRVHYDNGESDDVDIENVSPNTIPINFGEEADRLEEGEFCEVFNNSITDPAAWLGRVSKVNKKTYSVEYPFHDAPPETIKEQHIRRARVWEEATESWKYLKPNQEWEDGEVSSPMELELCNLKELKAALSLSGRTAEVPGDDPPAQEIPGPQKGARKSTPAKPDALAAAVPAALAAALPLAAPAAAVEPAPDKPKRGRPRKTPAEKEEAKALKKQKKEAEAAVAAQASAVAAMPAMMMPPSSVPHPGMMPPNMPPTLQGIQNLLAQPGMLPLLQALMAGAQGGSTARPPFPVFPPGVGMTAVAPAASAAPAAAPMPAATPAQAPPPPPVIDIPPLPEEEDEEEEEPAAEAKVPPRKARSAYILFSMDFRKNLSKEMSFNDATRQAAQKWKEADEATKQKFDDLANTEREEYVRLQTEYMEYKKKMDAKREQKAAKMQIREEAFQKHEDAKRRQMEMNKAYLEACAAKGYTPVPVPQIPGMAPAMADSAAGETSDDRINHQLNKLDLEKARKHVLKYYHEDAWYMLVDVWRRGSAKLDEALASAKMHVYSKLRADWRGFMMGIFGLEKMTELARKEGDPEPEAEDFKQEE